jgi:hypothetical protein
LATAIQFAEQTARNNKVTAAVHRLQDAKYAWEEWELENAK